MGEEALRKRCAKAFQEPDEILLALKWCTKRKTVKDVFEKIGLKLLNKQSSDEDWKRLILELYGSNSVINISQAKDLCENIGNLNTTDDDFIDTFEEADSGCVIPIN